MTERIYKIVDGELVAQEGGRVDGKTYSAIGRDPDGADRLREWSDAEVVARENEPVIPQTTIDGAAFLSRVTDQEYADTLALAQSNAQVARWLDILRMRGVIDVSGNTARAAKAGLVQLGVLTAERADVIFAP